MADIRAWHGKSLSTHTSLRDDATKAGYRFLSLSLHGSVDAPLYTAVMIKRAQIVAQRDWPLLTADQFAATFQDQVAKGYGPVIIAATGSWSDPRFAAVFQPQNPIALTRHRLRFGNVNDLNTIQGMNWKAKKDGLILRWAASYGDPADWGFAAIWVPHTDKTVWNADGLLDSVSDFQKRAQAQTQGWARPAFVTPNGANQYLSAFADDEFGGWVLRWDMSKDAYQNEFNTWTSNGYLPSVVQGAGVEPNTRYAAIFVKSEDRIARQWHATGPVANTAIDDVMKSAMQEGPCKHAALAIVHGKRLVYARGYTWAEPDWPVVQPTTLFRIQSCSKAVTSLAIHQLIETHKLDLGETVQSILQLQTPSGASPNTLFSTITVRHLLEHTSGLNPQAARNDISIRDAFKTAHPGVQFPLPVSAEMTDSYIASLSLVSVPGTAQAYNNCGYYLLGRVLAKRRKTNTPMDALHANLLNPLGITRIRRAPTRLEDQPADEARYRHRIIVPIKGDPNELDIAVTPSVMSDSRPWVPLGYGNEQYEKQEGSGGLSAAATDLARLVAILIDPDDNPALKRKTITDMFANAIACQQTWKGPNDYRAGYGLDRCVAQTGGKYYGQKGGSLETSKSTIQFSGDWGYVVVWGGKPVSGAATKQYPDFHAVMDIARNTSWSSQDLFPQFGMASL